MGQLRKSIFTKLTSGIGIGVRGCAKITLIKRLFPGYKIDDSKEFTHRRNVWAQVDLSYFYYAVIIPRVPFIFFGIDRNGKVHCVEGRIVCRL